MERTRVTIYTIGLAVAFGVYLVIHGEGRGAPFWTVAGLAFAGMLLGLPLGDAGRRSLPFRAGVLAAGSLALVVPLAVEMARAGAPLGELAMLQPVWPQILVAFFASRALAAESECRFADFWLDPFSTVGSVQIQSTAAAVMLGAALALAFHVAVPWLKGLAVGGPAGVVVGALAGDTFLHAAIIVMFFVVLAHLADAMRLHLRDRAAVTAIRRFGRDHHGPAALRAHVAAALDAMPESGILRQITGWLDRRSGQAASGPDGFHRASRQFVRGLVPFLPLLGFLGTVVGLATALAEIPRGLGDGRGGGLDVAASLGGLAIKFETTLLGLLASMIAAILIAVIERRETELVAEAGRLVELIVARPGGPDAA